MVTVVFTTPVPVPGGLRVAKVGRAAVRAIIAPGTPDAWTGTDTDPPPATVTSAMGVIMSVGALATRTCVTLVPERALAAVNWKSYSPASAAPGVQANVADVFEPLGVNVAPIGRAEALRDVMASASASLAVTTKVSVEPAVTSSNGGAETTGA